MLGVEVEDAIEAADIHERAAVVQTTVAIAAAESVGKKRRAISEQFPCDLVHPCWAQDFAMRRLRIITPTLVARVWSVLRRSGGLSLGARAGFDFYIGSHLYDYRPWVTAKEK